MFYGICGSDLHVLKGGRPFTKPPVISGHEIVARVMEMGNGVKSVQSGDHVVVDPIMACMEYRAYKTGRSDFREPPQVAGFRASSFARSRHIVPARNCHIAPAFLPLRVLTFARPTACARHCVNRIPEAFLESVLVVGVETISSSIVQVLRIMGADKITMTGPGATKRVLVLKLSAAEVWAPGELAADIRFTGAIDVAAAQATLNDACAHVYAGGTAMCMGVPSGPHEIPLPMIQHFRRGLLNSGMYIPEDFGVVIEWLADGQFDTNELATDLSAIEDATVAFERAQQNDSIEVMLQFAPE